MGNKGKREFIQILILLEAMPMEVVTFAAKEAIHVGLSGSTQSSRSRWRGSSADLPGST